MKKISNKEYRKMEGISRSELWQMNKSPLHFKYFAEHKEDDSPALLFGRACHKYILENDDFENEFAIMPDVDGRTKIGKETKNKFEKMAKNRNLEIITQEDFETIKVMAEQIDNNELARELLTGETEQSFFWTDGLTGEKCKVRPDCLNREKNVIVDYKTTQSCENFSFERSVKKYGYKFQAGMYTEGVFQNLLEPFKFVFVAQEKNPPYAVRIYSCSEEFVRQGYDKFRELLGLYHKCKELDEWKGYEFSGINFVELQGDFIE